MNTCLCAPSECSYWHCRNINQCMLADNKPVRHAPLYGFKFRKSKSKVMPNKRAKVYARDNHQCKFCGSKENLTIDHIRPRSKGGANDLNNLQTLCLICNQKKADK